MRKRALQTSLKGALDAELQGRASAAVAETDMAGRNVKCSRQYALSAAEIQWFLSSRLTTSLFIVRTASNHGGGQEVDIEEPTRFPYRGGVFYIP